MTEEPAEHSRNDLGVKAKIQVLSLRRSNDWELVPTPLISPLDLCWANDPWTESAPRRAYSPLRYVSQEQADPFSPSAPRPTYSPPRFVSKDEIRHMHYPGVAAACWARKEAFEATLEPEPLMDLREPRRRTPEPEAPVSRPGRSRAATVQAVNEPPRGRELSRAYDIAIAGKHNATKLVDTVVRKSSRLARSLSKNGRQVLERAASMSRSKQRKALVSREETRPRRASISKGDISRPQRAASMNDHFQRTDFLTVAKYRAAQVQEQEHKKEHEQHQLRRKKPERDLRKTSARTSSLTDPYHPTDSSNDYQKFLFEAAKAEKGCQAHAEISSLVKREDADNISIVLQDYLKQVTALDAQSAELKHSSTRRQSGPSKLTFAQRTMNQIVMTETGDEASWL